MRYGPHTDTYPKRILESNFQMRGTYQMPAEQNNEFSVCFFDKLIVAGYLNRDAERPTGDTFNYFAFALLPFEFFGWSKPENLIRQFDIFNRI